MRHLMFFAAIGLLAACHAGETIEEKDPPPELTDTAYEIAMKEMAPDEWDQYVLATKKKYDSWAAEHENASFGRFLNDKFMEMAPSARGGKIPNLKKLMYWLALYKYFDEPPPGHIREVSDKHKWQFHELSKDFSWEKLSNLVSKAEKEYVSGGDSRE